MNALRMAALGLAALISTPAAAQSPTSAMEGVWQGTLGDQQIMACFNGNGVFYTTDDMELTLLLEEESGWQESGEYAEDDDRPFWQFAVRSDGMAFGTRQEGDALQETRLERVSHSVSNDYDSPCSSAAFMEPRLRGGSIGQNAAVFEGTSIVQYTFVPPAHFQAEGEDDFAAVNIRTFGLAPQQFYDREINAALKSILPEGNMGDAYADCFAWMADRGRDGDYSREIAPEMINERWLVASDSQGVYCGGAHGSYWTEYRVFDRNTGNEVNTRTWLSDAAFTPELSAYGQDSYVSRTATDAFREAVRPHLDPELMDGCVDAVMTATSWRIGLAEDGLALIPVLPHVVNACAGTVVLPWDAAEPFLSIDGQAVRLSLTPTE